MKIFTIKGFKYFIFSLVVTFFSINIFAQVPPNDEPCGAIVLTPTAACNYNTYTNVDASDSQAPGIPNPTPFIACGPYAGGDVWFITTVPVGATSMVFDTKNLTMSDGAMTIYTATGTCPSLTMTQVGCADDGSANPAMPKITVTQPAGTVLYVRIYGVGGELGTFGICVTANVPPINDNCLNAITLTVNPDYNCGVISTGHTTINATQSPNTPLPTCSSTGVNDDVWFSFVATGTDHRISLLSLLPTTASMAIAVYEGGSCTSILPPTCVNGSVFNLTGLTPGNINFIRVYTTSAATTTNASFSICIGTLPPPPLNDECAGAVNLTVNSTLTCVVSTAGTTQSATLSTPAPTPSCGAANGYNDDVWYKFIATSTDHRLSLSNILPAATGMVMVTYAGSCGGLTEIACSTSSPSLLSGLTIGNSYYVRVYTNTATAATIANFDICITTPPPAPSNDNCISAVSLTVNPTLVCTSTTIGTTQSATQSGTAPIPSCGVLNANNDDVWFSFIATSTTHRISLPTVTPTGTGMVIVAYSGTCVALTEIGCSTSSLLGLFGLTIGNPYYVRVFTNSAAVLIFSDFTICVATPPPPPPNDECLGAISLTVNPNYLCGVITSSSTQYATPSVTAPAPTCGAAGINDDVWFSFTATSVSHRINVSNIVGTTSLTKVVYSGTCGALTQIICTATNIFNVNGLTIGNTYYVRVYTTSSAILESGSFDICVGSPPPPPPNDNCAGAVNLTVNPDLLCGVSTFGSITSATASSGVPVPSCAATGIDDDVWYAFTATNTTHRITLTNITPTTPMAVVVYSGTCTGLTEIFCNTTNLFNVSGLTIGQTYYVRVYSTGTTPNLEVDFRVCVGTLPPPPPNDECTGAISLPISTNLTCANPTAGSTLSATQSTNLPAPTCGGANGWNDDVWFSIVAASTSHRISLTNITGPTSALVTTVYSGTCGALTLLTCNTANAFDVNNLTIGITYYIRVHTSVSTFEDASFNICIGSPAPNKTCSTSIPFCNQGPQFVDFTSTQGILSAPGGGGTGSIYGCLGTTPNQNWFDIGVLTAGPINIQISQTGGNASNDVDFAAWGPFTSPADGCNRLFASGPPLQPIPNTGGNNGCSYSTAAIENFRVVNALPGQFYKLLVTNFSTSNNNLPPFTTPSQFVKLTNLVPTTSGAATLDCNFPCFNATANNSGPVCGGGTFNLFSTGSTTPFNWTGPIGFTSASQNPTGIVAPTVPGSYDYTVTIGTGTGACVKTTTLVVTTPPPAPTVAATAPSYCQGATNAVALIGTASAGNTLRWYTTSTGGTFTTSIIPNTVVTTTYYVTQITAGGCESSPRTPITVTITPTPVAPSVISPVIHCQNETAVALSATATAGNSILYYTVATGGTSITTLTPLTTAAGTTTYFASQITTNGCESPRSPITVTVKPRPSAPITTDQIFCEGSTMSPLTAGGLVSGANLLWYTAATGGSPIPTPTPSNTFNSTYYVSQILNGCESPRTALRTTITPTPAAPTVSPTQPSYCQGVGNAVPLAATASAGNTLLWYTTATGGTGTTTLTPNTSTTTTYYVSQVNSGGCEGPRSALTVTITPTPAAPVLTQPAAYCENETALPLSATATAGNSILYYTLATGGTGATTLTPLTTAAGTTTYYASQITANGCQGPRSSITVTVKARPGAPTTTDQIFCEGTTLAPLTPGGLVSGASLLWYAAATGGTSISTPTPSNTANSTFYVSQILNGCESPRAALTTTITPTPAAPAIAATQPTYCQGVTNAVPLTATASAGNTLLWYTTATGGTGTTTLTPNTTATATYYVSQVTAGGCESPRTSLTITITPTPTAPAVNTPASYCENETAVPLSATATAGNSILYYTVATGGTGVTMLTPTTTTAGTTTFYASQITANGCEGPRSPIDVIVKPRPGAPTTTDQIFCEGTTLAPLTAGALVPGASLLWYAASMGGTPIPTPTPSNTANSTFYVSQILNGCESPRAPLTTTITPTPVAPVVISPIQLCPNEMAIPLQASLSTGNTLKWYSSQTGGVSSLTAPTPSTLAQGTFNFYVSQVTSNGCESPRSNITVTVSNNNLVVNAGVDKTICEGRKVTLFPVVSSPLATFQWRSLNVPINTIDSIIIKNVTVNPVDTAVYVVKALLNGCSVEDTIQVNVIWKPIIDAGKNMPICVNDSVLLNGMVLHTANSNIDFLWTSNSIDTLNTPDQLQTYAHPIRKTLYTLTATTDSLKYGCDFKVADSMIVAIQPIIKAFAGKDTIAAKGVSHQLHGTGGLNYIWSSPSGVSIINAFRQNAYVKLNDDANFYLEVSDAIGCKGYDSIFVKVYNGNTYYVPNSFTPNGDGLNDIFRAIPVGMSNTVYFRVFNRLGELMFETNQYLKGWDGTYKGKPQPSGVYVWMVGGTDRDNKKVTMQGTVMLIR